MTQKTPAVALVSSLMILSSAAAFGAGGAVVHFESAEVAAVALAIPVGGALRLEGLSLRDTKGGAGRASGKDRAGRASGATELAALELERFEVFTRNARVIVHGDGGEAQLPVPHNLYFRGRIAGEPNSSAFFTVLERGGLRGLVSQAGEYWLMEAAAGFEKSSPGLLQVRRFDPGVELAHKSSGFACGSDRLEKTPAEVFASVADGADDANLPVVSSLPAPAKAAGYTARVAIETDYEFLQLFGGNVAAATDYVGDLFAYASGIYAAEVDTSMMVHSLDLWSVPGDPWDQTSPSCALYQFGRYWNDNKAGNTRTIAHFLSGKNVNGGVAWLGVLCRGSFNVNLGTSCPSLSPQTDNYGGGYGFTGGIDGNFDINNPGIVWDIMAVSHEIGHNFNSPHTHCYGGLGGNASPVDQCYGGHCGGSGCYCGSASLPCGQTGAGCGTIMSYCHLLFQGGLSNVSMTFGQGHSYGVAPERVPSRMNDHVASQAAINPSCLTYDPASEGAAGMIFADGFESGNLNLW